MIMKKVACTLLIVFQLVGCSTSGGIYKQDDSVHGEFSLGRTALTILGVAAAVAAAKGGGGSGYAAPPQFAPTDYEWDWDLFYNQYRQLTWACRGVQSGQFAELDKCQYKLKVDQRWPSLEAPR
jgi:hypothetical protein